MGRNKYPNEIYKQKQRAAILNCQTLTNSQMASKLGITYAMYKRYLAGQSPMPDDLLYIRAMEDVDIAVFARNLKKEMWSL
jgi:predicted transcriptional regulator